MAKGIAVYEGTGAVTIEGNAISRPGSEGIFDWYGTLTTTANHVDGGPDHGIHADPTEQADIQGSWLKDNRVGIAIARGSARSNSVHTTEIGIMSRGSAEIRSNEMLGGRTGVATTTGSRTIVNNDIRGNAQGLVVGSACSRSSRTTRSAATTATSSCPTGCSRPCRPTTACARTDRRPSSE